MRHVSLDVARLLLASRVSLPTPPAGSTRSPRYGRRYAMSVSAKFGAKGLREFRGLWVGLGIKEVLKEAEEGGELIRKQERVLGLLRGESIGKDEVGGEKEVEHRLLPAPVGYNVAAPANLRDDAPMARRAGRYERVATDLVVTSLGYEGEAAMFEDASVPWYDISRAQVADAECGRAGDDARRGGRAAGLCLRWAGRGAEGVLTGTLVAQLDANDLAAAIVEDSEEGGNEGALLARGEEVQLAGVPGGGGCEGGQGY
ncbi:hypothetical protein JB92DRAFT_2824670 [Gautieria morchelliformis]|nr:hypothetical protein JB92DRAFT_2824670 [Gautieria morchelliformis]